MAQQATHLTAQYTTETDVETDAAFDDAETFGDTDEVEEFEAPQTCNILSC